MHTALGDRTTALDLLERAYDERDSTIVNLKVDPRLDEIRSEVRFTQLIKRLGL